MCIGECILRTNTCREKKQDWAKEEAELNVFATEASLSPRESCVAGRTLNICSEVGKEPCF